MRTAPPPHGGSRKDWLGLSVSSSNGIVLRDLQLAKYWLVQYAILWRILKFHELHAYRLKSLPVAGAGRALHSCGTTEKFR